MGPVSWPTAMSASSRPIWSGPACAAVVCWNPSRRGDVPLRGAAGDDPARRLHHAALPVILVGVQGGNPAVVQTAVATAPLVSLGFEVAPDPPTSRRGRGLDGRGRLLGVASAWRSILLGADLSERAHRHAYR